MEEFLLRWGSLIIATAGFVFALGSARGKAASDRVAKLESKIEEKASAAEFRGAVVKLDLVEDRVSVIEGEVKHLPDRNITHRLELAISALEGQIRVMDERLKPVSAMATRAQELMFEEAKRDRVA